MDDITECISILLILRLPVCKLNGQSMDDITECISILLISRLPVCKLKPFSLLEM